MGFIADEPLGDLLDEQGLDHAGKSLREQQRKAQAIDRDLPDNTGIDDHIADAFSGVDYGKMLREVQANQSAQQRAIRDAFLHGQGRYTNFIPKNSLGKCPGNAPVTGRDRFTIKGKYAHLNDKELAQDWHNAKSAGKHDEAREIHSEANRRQQEKADG